MADRAAAPRRRSWRSTSSCASPTTSPTMRSCAPHEKLAQLDRLEASLLGERRRRARGRRAARRARRARAVAASTRSDLLDAFRQDVTKLRYADWDELIDYCRYSAMPVGRFVLDVHGESRATWPASDAVCAALQIINHLQDCAQGLPRARPRLYSARRAGGGRRHASRRWRRRRAPAIAARACTDLAARTGALLDEGARFSAADRRLRAWRWRSPPSSALADGSSGCCWRAIRLSETRPSRQAGRCGRRLGAAPPAGCAPAHRARRRALSADAR